MQHKWHHWATGNYLLDYEDSIRGYGGIIQIILIANQHTGFPSFFRLTAEQHSFEMSSKFEIHVKVEGLTDGLKHEMFKSMMNLLNESVNETKLLEILEKAKFAIRKDDDFHFETIVKINEQTIFCHHFNKTTFTNFAFGKIIIQNLYKISHQLHFFQF